MYVLTAGCLGEDQVSKPKPMTLVMRPKPYLSLDRFDYDKSSLTARLQGLVNDLAKAVTQSLNTNQPITAVRLIGHADSNGAATYNVGLGDRRARSVAEALPKKLKTLANRVKIVVEPSPGKSEPLADNRTREGRATNRRVEVFVTVTLPPKPAKKKPINLWDLHPLPDSVVRTKPNPYTQIIPGPRPGQSPSDWLEEKFQRVPSWLRTPMRDAIVAGTCSVLATLVERAGFAGPEKEALQSTCKAAAKTKSQ